MFGLVLLLFLIQHLWVFYFLNYFLIPPCFHMKASLCNSGSFFFLFSPLPCPFPQVATRSSPLIFEQMEGVLQTGLVFSLQTCHGLPLEFFCCIFCCRTGGFLRLLKRASVALFWVRVEQRETESKKIHVDCILILFVSTWLVLFAGRTYN